MSYANNSTPSVARCNPADFAQDVASLAGELLITVPDLNDAERHMLKDVRDGRHRFVVFSRIITIATRSEKPEHHEAPAEIVRQIALAAVPRPMSITSAFDAENDSNHDANMAQTQFERRPSRVTFDRLRAALTRQLSGTRGALDAAYRSLVVLLVALTLSGCADLLAPKPKARQCSNVFTFRADSVPDTLVVRRCP